MSAASELREQLGEDVEGGSFGGAGLVQGVDGGLSTGIGFDRGVAALLERVSLRDGLEAVGDRLVLRDGAIEEWVQGYEITGEPYPEDDVCFLPTELKMANGKTETQTIMIKFYDFDGAKRCFSIGSKEKGVVD